ncbi:MAG: amino acid amidase [Epulopiscium sp.]|nr:amino acid amidase [Candidatus Epulonipiscium sp.]
MRIYISADIEGISGITHWQETRKDYGGYTDHAKQLSREVAAACNGALRAGAKEIIVKDAHEDGNNIIHKYLPKEAKLIRGWSNHPYSMVEGIDSTYDGAIMIGYHSGAYSNGSPLSHTLSPDTVSNIKINGQDASEFLIHAYICHSLNVPVLAVTGDEDLVLDIRRFDPNIATLAMQKGFGNANISIHPDLALERIEAITQKGIENRHKCKCHKLEKFELEVIYKNHTDAYRASFYPGARQVSEFKIIYYAFSYIELMSALMFIT